MNHIWPTLFTFLLAFLPFKIKTSAYLSRRSEQTRKFGQSYTIKHRGLLSIKKYLSASNIDIYIRFTKLISPGCKGQQTDA